MPCVGDVVSEKLFRVPNDTSVESMRRMFFGSISASAAAISGSLERPTRWSIDATGPDEGLSVETRATVAGAPQPPAVTTKAAANAPVTFRSAFTVIFEGGIAKLWAPFHAGKRWPRVVEACGRDRAVRFGP